MTVNHAESLSMNPYRDNKNCTCKETCFDKLYPSQEEMLRRIEMNTGVVEVPSPIGAGKTYTMILAPIVADVERAVVIESPHMLSWFQVAYHKLEEHFIVPSIAIDLKDNWYGVSRRSPSVLHVVTTATISRPDGNKVLDEIRPQMICIAKSSFKNVKLARSLRVFDYVKSNKDVKLCIWKDI